MFSLALLALAGAATATTITNDRSVAVNKTFDYVIAGGGLSGIVVANRLSSEGYSVLIIEAGPDARDVPAVLNAEERSNLNGFCNWEYPVVDEAGNALSWLVDSGACVGGSTSIHGMVWFRPARPEIDILQQLGNPGWNWNTLIPYLESVERFTPPDEIQVSQGAGYNPAVHGFNGPINVSFPTPLRIPKSQQLYKEALPLVFPGLKVTNDLSSRTSTVSASTSWSIWYNPETQKNTRSSAAYGLLYPAEQQRDSLTVLTEHTVGKILFKSDRDLTARGVQFGNASHGGLFEVYASKEVILAAGSLASAPILERSGVGSSSILRRAGVKQLLNLPGVGLNLNDQPGTGTSALVNESFRNDTGIIDGRNLFAPVISLVNNEQLFGTNNAPRVNWELLRDLGSRAAAVVRAGAAANIPGALAVLGAQTSLIVNNKYPVAEIVGESYPAVFTSIFWPLLPLSRGYVHISSSDPFASPSITPRLLSDSFDQKVATAIARKSRGLFTSAPFQEYVADAYADPSDVGPDATDAQYLDWFRNTSFGASHWVGSTSLLPRNLGGVVDPRLRVYGTKKLRIVDAGILPIQFTTHTQSVLYTTSLRAADLILADA